MTNNKTVDLIEMPKKGWRILGFGADEDIALTNQNRMRDDGLRATVITVADDVASDKRLTEELKKDTYDGVAIGGLISSQMPGSSPTSRMSLWFERLLNIVQDNAPATKIILVLGPDDILPAVKRVLG
jgi:hypothetical protein